jgi:LPS export ABC transporter protein LptC
MRRTLLLLTAVFLGACSFDYGQTEPEAEDQPDVLMRQVEYVRVRDGDPTVRFQAELAERYEKRQTMELRNFSFEQFDTRAGEVNAQGRAGAALMELDSGDVRLEDGVRLEIESEDITIETAGLDWKDKNRELLGEGEAEVNILRSDGTSFTGRGFSANARTRTWEFSAGAEGTYTHEDAEEEAPPPEDGEEGEAEPPEAGEAEEAPEDESPEGAGETSGAAP